MSELKTLKDMDFMKEMFFEDGNNSYFHPIEFCMEDVKELKEEAIKWYKFAGNSKRVEYLKIFIQNFFNLTDEDLNQEVGDE